MTEKRKDILGQALIIVGIIYLFIWSAFFSQCTAVEVSQYVMNIMTAVGVTVPAVVFYLNRKKINLYDIVDRNVSFLCFWLYFISLRVLQFGTLPRWDSDTYFYALRHACENFSYTIESFLEYFKLASHLSYGYSIFLATGFYAFRGNYVGIYVINLILTSFAFYFTYEILRSIFENHSKKVVSFCTFIIWCMPMCLGMSTNISLDYGVMIFLIYILYFHLKKKHILFGFFALILVFTKEVGVVCLAGYGFGCLVSLCLKSEKKGIFKIIEGLKDKFILTMLGLGIFDVLYQVYIRINSESAWGSIDGMVKPEKHNVFAFNSSYIVLKLKTMFLLNFNWIWIIVIIACGYIFLFKQKKSILDVLKEKTEYVGYLSAIVFFVIFSCLYLTFNNQRYNFCVEYMLAFVGVILFLETVKISLNKVLVLGVICALFLGQSYVTIDPITKLCFPMVDTGSAFPMISAGWSEMNSLQADITVYNYQYTYIDEAYDEILRVVNYTKDKDVVFWGNYDPGVRATCISGLRTEYFWDFEREKRVAYENENTCKISVVYEKDFESLRAEKKLQKEAIFIYTPHFLDNEAEALLDLQNYYTIEERQEVSVSCLGKVIFYKMILK